MIEIDGNYQEGGGQILRTALALSTLTQKPFVMKNIRKGRCEPGLKTQHFCGIDSLQRLCDAEVKGLKMGSTEIEYIPHEISKSSMEINIGTAGSITLLMQSLLIPCIFAKHPISLKVTGGTDVQWSQPIDYFQHVFLPSIKRFAKIEFKLIQRGYYPRGGGIVDIKIIPQHDYHNVMIEKFGLLNQGKLMQINGLSHASIDLKNADVAERQADAASKLLEKLPLKIETEYCEAFSTGSGITLWAEFPNSLIGGDGLGKRGKKAEDVGREAAINLLAEMKTLAPVDQYLADQLIPFLAIAKGSFMTSRITPHTLSNIYVTEKFLDVKFRINKNIVEC
jgi:RNA 3'-phosphate cyclase